MKMDVSKTVRAWVRQPSGRHLDLLNPRPEDWSNEDLAIGLSRTFRWGGHSTWPLPLSVAQHSLTVLALVTNFSEHPLTHKQVLRELLYDSEEGLIGGFDAIKPLKPFLGKEFEVLCMRMLSTVFHRYDLTQWTNSEYACHKQVDNIAAASEALYVAGWSSNEIREDLEIRERPLAITGDPLVEIYGCDPWEPWPPEIAAQRFLEVLETPELAITRFRYEKP